MFDIVNSALSTDGFNMFIKIIFWLVILLMAIDYANTKKER